MGWLSNITIEQVLTVLLWWASFGAMFTAYRYRKMWDIGTISWVFLLSAFLTFGVRELVPLAGSPLVVIIQNVSGIWSGILFSSAFVSIYRRIYLKKPQDQVLLHVPFVLCLLIPPLVALSSLSGAAAADISGIMGPAESLVWLLAAVLVMYTTFMLGTCSTGGFIRVYFFVQIAAYFAFLWKLFGLLQVGNYAVVRGFELLFVSFTTFAVYTLARMLKSLSARMYGS